jgi:hypothetical protein
MLKDHVPKKWYKGKERGGKAGSQLGDLRRRGQQLLVAGLKSRPQPVGDKLHHGPAPSNLQLFNFFDTNFCHKNSISSHIILQVAFMQPLLSYRCEIRGIHNLICANEDIMEASGINTIFNSRVANCHNVDHAHDQVMFSNFLHLALYNNTTNLQSKNAK